MFDALQHRKRSTSAHKALGVAAAVVNRNTLERENKRRNNRRIGGVWAA